jgi:hypothetical protein
MTCTCMISISRRFACSQLSFVYHCFDVNLYALLLLGLCVVCKMALACSSVILCASSP